MEIIECFQEDLENTIKYIRGDAKQNNYNANIIIQSVGYNPFVLMYGQSYKTYVIKFKTEHSVK